MILADLVKNVRDDEGHEHGADGKFVSTGGSSGAPKGLPARRKALMAAGKVTYALPGQKCKECGDYPEVLDGMREAKAGRYEVAGKKGAYCGSHVVRIAEDRDTVWDPATESYKARPKEDVQPKPASTLLPNEPKPGTKVHEKWARALRRPCDISRKPGSNPARYGCYEHHGNLWDEEGVTRCPRAAAFDAREAPPDTQIGRAKPGNDHELGLVAEAKMYGELKEKTEGRYPGNPLAEELLKHGRFFEYAPLHADHKKGTPGNCFQDAANLAFKDPDLTYCEGFATAGILTVHHAWCVDKEGRVVDPTWAAIDHKEPHFAYWGVPIDTDALRVRVLRDRTWGYFNKVARYIEKPIRKADFVESEHPRDKDGKWTTCATCGVKTKPEDAVEHAAVHATEGPSEFPGNKVGKGTYKIGEAEVKIVDYDEGDVGDDSPPGVDLQAIKVPEEHRGKGEATRALQAVTAWADATGKNLYLWPEPIGDKPMSEQQLRAFYEKHGFKVFSGMMMLRKPAKLKTGQVRKLDDIVKADFDESEHPRDADGKFTEGPNAGGRKPNELLRGGKRELGRLGSKRCREILAEYHATFPGLDDPDKRPPADYGEASKRAEHYAGNDDSMTPMHVHTYGYLWYRLARAEYLENRREERKGSEWHQNYKGRLKAERERKAERAAPFREKSDDELTALVNEALEHTVKLPGSRRYTFDGSTEDGKKWSRQYFGAQDELNRRAKSGTLTAISYGVRQHDEVPAATKTNKAEVADWVHKNLLSDPDDRNPARTSYLDIPDKKFVDEVSDAVYDNLQFVGMPKRLNHIVKGVRGLKAVATACTDGTLSVSGTAVKSALAKAKINHESEIWIPPPPGDSNPKNGKHLKGPHTFSDPKAPLRAIINHEMGHFLWYALQAQNPSRVSDFMSAWRKARAEMPEEMAKHSIYAMKNPVEGFAEYYAMWRSGLQDEFPAPIKEFFKAFQEAGYLKRRPIAKAVKLLRDLVKSADDVVPGKPLHDDSDVSEDGTIIIDPLEDLDEEREADEDEDAEKTRTLGDIIKTEFVESDHPRDEEGKFTTVGGAWKQHIYAKEGKVAHVPLDWLRSEGVKGNRLGKTDLEELKAEIEERGIDEPLMIAFDNKTNRVKLGEGNHRAEALHQLGYTHAPVRALRSEIINMGVHHPVSEHVGEGYVAADMNPADIGIPGAVAVPKPKAAKGRTLGDLIKVVDDSGHKHDDAGRFSATSGHAKPKPKKVTPGPTERPIVPRLEKEPTGRGRGPGGPTNFDNIMWSDVGLPTLVRSYHAGRTWNGAHANRDPVERWDHDAAKWDPADVDLLERIESHRMRIAEAAEALIGITTRFGTPMRDLVDYSPTAGPKYKERPVAHALKRAALKREFMPLIYDLNRATRLEDSLSRTESFLTSERRKRDVGYHVRTQKIAELLATKAPQTLDDAMSDIYNEVRAGRMKDSEKLQSDVAREFLLYRHGVSLVSRHNGESSLGRMNELPMRDIADMDDNLLKGGIAAAHAIDVSLRDYGHLHLHTQPTTVAFTQPSGTYLGLCAPQDNQFTIYTPPGDPTTKNTIAHEMAHAQTYGALGPEYQEFSRFMTKKYDAAKPEITDWFRREASEKGLDPRDAENLNADMPKERLASLFGGPTAERLDAFRNMVARRYFTEHGVNSGNHTRRSPVVDPQEDWAIGISEHLMPNERGSLRSWHPLKSTVEKLAALTGLEERLPASVTDGTKTLFSDQFARPEPTPWT